MNKYNRSQILKMAHSLKKTYNLSFGEAQKISWLNTKLKMALHEGPISFSYRKKDGTVRDAIGTLHNIQHLLVGSNKFENDVFTLRYYDLEKESFRALKINNLISIN